MTSTDTRTQLLELIARAQDNAGDNLPLLQEAYRIARQLGEDHAMAMVTTDRQRAALGAAEVARLHLVRDRNATLDALTRSRAETEAARESARVATAARDAAADRIAELADERDALTLQLTQMTMSRDAIRASQDRIRKELDI